jgi:hypothetical protein
MMPETPMLERPGKRTKTNNYVVPNNEVVLKGLQVTFSLDPFLDALEIEEITKLQENFPFMEAEAYVNRRTAIPVHGSDEYYDWWQAKMTDFIPEAKDIAIDSESYAEVVRKCRQLINKNIEKKAAPDKEEQGDDWSTSRHHILNSVLDRAAGSIAYRECHLEGSGVSIKRCFGDEVFVVCVLFLLHSIYVIYSLLILTFTPCTRKSHLAVRRFFPCVGFR